MDIVQLNKHDFYSVDDIQHVRLIWNGVLGRFIKDSSEVCEKLSLIEKCKMSLFYFK